MRRFSALLLVIVLLCNLSACGSSEDKKSDSKRDKESDFKITINAPKDNEDPSETENAMTFTEMTAIDNDKCFIKITEIYTDDIWGFTIKTQLENRSSEKTYSFTLDNAAINGVECSSFFAEEVAAGKKAVADINFYDELDKYDIGLYTDIELTFRVYDSNDYFADDIAKETIHIYPFGEELATKYVREPQDSDYVIADNEYAKAVVIGYEYDDIWGYTVHLFLMNKTDYQVVFTADDVSINGFMAEPYFSSFVAAGKCAFKTMTWSDSTLEESGITEIEEIEFNFRVYNCDNWGEDDFVNEAVILNP